MNLATDSGKIQILGKQVKLAEFLDLWEAVLCATIVLPVHLQGDKVALVSGLSCSQGQAVYIHANSHFTSHVFEEHLEIRHMQDFLKLGGNFHAFNSSDGFEIICCKVSLPGLGLELHLK